MRLMLLALPLLAIASCASTPPAAPYAAPASSGGTIASISGSQIVSTSFLLADSIAFVSRVDGKAIEGGTKTWKQSIPIVPGVRKITAAFSLGSYRASADLAFSALPDHAYQLQAKSNAKVRGGDYYCDFWIIDAGDSSKVSDVVRADVTYTKWIWTP